MVAGLLADRHGVIFSEPKTCSLMRFLFGQATSLAYSSFLAAYDLRSSGTLPPFSASFCMTCPCNQMFIDAESLVSPV